jgi:hypothetical protein
MVRSNQHYELTRISDDAVDHAALLNAVLAHGTSGDQQHAHVD